MFRVEMKFRVGDREVSLERFATLFLKELLRSAQEEIRPQPAPVMPSVAVCRGGGGISHLGADSRVPSPRTNSAGAKSSHYLGVHHPLGADCGRYSAKPWERDQGRRGNPRSRRRCAVVVGASGYTRGPYRAFRRKDLCLFLLVCNRHDHRGHVLQPSGAISGSEAVILHNLALARQGRISALHPRGQACAQNYRCVGCLGSPDRRRSMGVAAEITTF